MPQIIRYGLITTCENNFMNAKTENIRNNSLISHSEKEKISHYGNLIKKLLYACEKCDGALVQLATCVVCKRTVLRICVCCNSVFNTHHISCKIAESSKHFEGLEMKN